MRSSHRAQVARQQSLESWVSSCQSTWHEQNFEKQAELQVNGFLWVPLSRKTKIKPFMLLYILRAPLLHAAPAFWSLPQLRAPQNNYDNRKDTNWYWDFAPLSVQEAVNLMLLPRHKHKTIIRCVYRKLIVQLLKYKFRLANLFKREHDNKELKQSFACWFNPMIRVPAWWLILLLLFCYMEVSR